MRDISFIKTQSQQREQKEIPSPNVQIKPEKSVSSLRLDELRKDKDAQVFFDRAKSARKLSELVKTKRKELQTIADATKSIVEGANKEADRIVVETKKRASQIISQAKSDNEKANLLLEGNIRKQTELENIEKELKLREESAAAKEIEQTKVQEHFKTERKIVDGLFQTASQYKVAAVDIFANTAAIFELAFEQMQEFEKISSQLPTQTSQTFGKAVKMMERTVVLVKSIDLDKSALQTKAKELQDWQEGLVDREMMLDRTAKEIKQKAKQ